MEMWCDDGRRTGEKCPDREFGEWICAECPHSKERQKMDDESNEAKIARRRECCILCGVGSDEGCDCHETAEPEMVYIATYGLYPQPHGFPMPVEQWEAQKNGR